MLGLGFEIGFRLGLGLVLRLGQCFVFQFTLTLCLW